MTESKLPLELLKFTHAKTIGISNDNLKESYPSSSVDWSIVMPSVVETALKSISQVASDLSRLAGHTTNVSESSPQIKSLSDAFVEAASAMTQSVTRLETAIENIKCASISLGLD